MSTESKDFYSILGLPRDCTSSDLRAAYKKLVLRWHPDKWQAYGNPRLVDEVKKRFQAIQEAYAVLSDEHKRFLYDTGVYDSEDDEGMDEFLDEMAEMMHESRQKKGTSESFEQLQDLFRNMFEADLNGFGKQKGAYATVCKSNNYPDGNNNGGSTGGPREGEGNNKSRVRKKGSSAKR
eukprot:TRINITY_DN163_c0_g1_i5.p2 TRINITY_DN163_c0_g1~~TRINITY_DN163_c0_g1_i5.p2  ORF type:complete len:179 (-),score=14.98 TRINITY_DN163_c0_g1_i5:373-909(-)